MGVVRLFFGKENHHQGPLDGNDMEVDTTSSTPAHSPLEVFDRNLALSSYCSIYQGAFVFDEEFRSRYETDAAAMLLFNLGLAYHLSAASEEVHGTSRGAFKNASNALHVYKLSMAAIDKHACTSGSSL